MNKGAAIAGADVSVTNVDTGYSRSDKSDKTGPILSKAFRSAANTLNVSGQGFKAFQVKDVVLHVNDSLTLDAQLRVGAKDRTIEVVATANQVELNNAELSGTVAGSQITELPLNGRSSRSYSWRFPAWRLIMASLTTRKASTVERTFPSAVAHRMRICFSWMGPTMSTWDRTARF